MTAAVRGSKPTAGRFKWFNLFIPIGALIIGAADRDFAAELDQVEVDGSAMMTKSNRPRDVSVRLDSYRRAIMDIFTANLADKIFVLQLQHTHKKTPRFT
jgi:hypothetical protein